MTYFVVALRAEARPLVERYRMKRADGPFPTFVGDGHRLVISGVGKVAAAAATVYLHDTPLNVWLNVGIGGHRDRAPGELVRAHTVTDAATGARFFPTRLGLAHVDAEAVTTVDAPEAEFPSSDVFDMEASAFYPAALRFSTAELTQCVKIVSDNRDTGTASLTSAFISELVESQLDTIDEVVAHLEAIAVLLEPQRVTLELEPFVSRWRFTTSEERRLHRLVGRLAAFGHVPEAAELRDRRDAADVLSTLEQRVRDLALEQRAF